MQIGITALRLFRDVLSRELCDHFRTLLFSCITNISGLFYFQAQGPEPRAGPRANTKFALLSHKKLEEVIKSF